MNVIQALKIAREAGAEGDAWLHTLCWETLHINWKAEAVATFSSFGIHHMTTSP